MVKRETSPPDTVPATRAARDRLSPVASGVRRFDDLNRHDAGPEELAQIRETLQVGTCIVVSDYVVHDARHLWSMWPGPDDSLVVTNWSFRETSGWSRGESFAIDSKCVTSIEGLLLIRRRASASGRP
jgi:hypothetical protein